METKLRSSRMFRSHGRWAAGTAIASCLAVLPVLAKTVYLDAQLTENCPGTYSVANRDCSGQDGAATMDLDSFHDMYDAAFASGDTLIIRPGRYWDGNFNAGLVLFDSAEGTAGAPTVVTTLPGEERQAVICASEATCGMYNPNPGDCGADRPLGNSFYPEAAITILGDFMEVRNLKTFGQIKLVSGQLASPIHEVLIEDCDLGGGGPSIGVASSQGMVVAIKNAYDITIRNNRIHHSACGDAPHNGAAILGYNFHAIVERNEFYDHYDAAIFIKDTGEIAGQPDRTFIVRDNLMHGVSLGGSSAGVRGQNQDPVIGGIEVSGNIIIGKKEGVRLLLSGATPTLVAGNTFVNSINYDIGEQANLSLRSGRAFNNLHYTDQGQVEAHSYFPSWTPRDVEIDFNCYATAGAGSFRWLLGGVRHVDLTSWQAVKDDRGVEIDPDFVGAVCAANSNCRAEDFKRRSYAEKLVGSPYGSHCGAYVTGDEVIGVDWHDRTACNDGRDNDGDGNIDLEDANCADTRGAAESLCGDGVKEGTAEACDGSDLAGQTCSGLGFTGGTLACKPGCSGFDTSSCQL